MITTKIIKVSNKKCETYYSIEILHSQAIIKEPKPYHAFIDFYCLEKEFFNMSHINYKQFKKMSKKYNAIFVRRLNHEAVLYNGYKYDLWVFEKETDAIQCKESLIDPLIIASLMSQ